MVAARSPSPASQQAEVAARNIRQISAEAMEWRSSVELFAGAKTDKQYIYLDEMLTQLLIKLDKIQSDGRDDIRTMRREAVKVVQTTLDQLELKAMSAGWFHSFRVACDSADMVIGPTEHARRF